MQESQRGLQHTHLKIRRMRRAKWTAKLERHPERAGRTHQFGIFAHKTDAGSCDTGSFKEMPKRAHGARAVGSNGDEKGRVDIVPVQEGCYFEGCRLNFMRLPPSTHDRVVKIRHGANFARRLHFAQPVNGKNHVHVILEAGSVEIDRRMAHRQIGRLDVSRNDTVANIRQVKRCITRSMQSGTRDDSDAPLWQRGGQSRMVRQENLGSP
jgi:hypothetical protein